MAGIACRCLPSYLNFLPGTDLSCLRRPEFPRLWGNAYRGRYGCGCRGQPGQPSRAIPSRSVPGPAAGVVSSKPGSRCQDCFFVQIAITSRRFALHGRPAARWAVAMPVFPGHQAQVPGLCGGGPAWHRQGQGAIPSRIDPCPPSPRRGSGAVPLWSHRQWAMVRSLCGYTVASIPCGRDRPPGRLHRRRPQGPAVQARYDPARETLIRHGADMSPRGRPAGGSLPPGDVRGYIPGKRVPDDLASVSSQGARNPAPPGRPFRSTPAALRPDPGLSHVDPCPALHGADGPYPGLKVRSPEHPLVPSLLSAPSGTIPPIPAPFVTDSPLAPVRPSSLYPKTRHSPPSIIQYRFFCSVPAASDHQISLVRVYYPCRTGIQPAGMHLLLQRPRHFARVSKQQPVPCPMTPP